MIIFLCVYILKKKGKGGEQREREEETVNMKNFMWHWNAKYGFNKKRSQSSRPIATLKEILSPLFQQVLIYIFKKLQGQRKKWYFLCEEYSC